MNNDLELIRIHVDALFTHDVKGRMRAVNEPDGAVAPRFFLGRAADGNEWRFRHDLGGDLVNALIDLCSREPVGHFVWEPSGNSRVYEDLLARHDRTGRVWCGPAYRFPHGGYAASEAVAVSGDNAQVLRPHFSDWMGDVSPNQPFFALLRDGRAVSICTSVRITDQAHEAGVETCTDFRGRGYASQVVSAWANAIAQRDSIPLYSTSWQNEPSRALAKKLGLIQYGADLHIA